MLSFLFLFLFQANVFARRSVPKQSPVLTEGAGEKQGFFKAYSQMRLRSVAD
jgi:hypothetical protein